ncbi:MULTISPECIES: ABC transporter ATP-binding protein [unclassified Arthrobacter]|uniref:ABC transporter ATP-binding protein n=1 Tax=unclassified Arthrobacter TaxID=235627 RepID=UPI001E32F0F6|nr:MULTISPECIES: ABC transporter ATP-binding protein [unclassified Arthrobacter]MCC9176056.1 ABC transporter ATP-binding protein [Arthrobacter sp. zg-Y750]MDK1327253.1 ABC transporter ATP-binding protein [Arthrobacter sp. zg-Y1143]
MQEQHTDRSEPPRLQLNGITVRFGGLSALDSVSLDIPAGAVVGVMGPNGAGKTTLFNVICGVFPPTGGSLALDGRDFHPRPHRLTRHGVARTLQGLGLFPGLTVLQNVMAGLAAESRRGADLLALPGAVRQEDQFRDRALAALAALDVAGYSAALPDTLPYGIRKKVALARALVSEPRLLLLDEPAGGLAHEDIEELASLIRTMPGNGCSVVLVEHHVDLVMDVCDRIAVLDFGRLIAEGTPAEIGADPAVADAYLGVDVA